MQQEIQPSTNRSHRHVTRILLAAIITMAAIAIVPTLSIAGDWFIGGESINGFLVSIIANLMSVISFLVTLSTKLSFVLGPIDELLGGNKTVWNLAAGVNESTIVPVAHSILALFMLLQLLKISQRMDTTATMPAIKDIFFLFVTCALIGWFINNSLDVLKDVYNVFNDAATALSKSNLTGVDGAEALKAADVMDALGNNKASFSVSSNAAGLIVYLALVSFIVWFPSIVAIIVCLARAFNITLMCAFAPIPIALLGFDETRQMGIGFLKNFASSCFTAVIIVFILIAYPNILGGFAGGFGFDAPTLASYLVSEDSSWTMPITALLPTAGISLGVMYALLKSESWASAILGS